MKRQVIFWTLILLTAFTMVDKKFVSNYNWFTLTYPNHWTEFEQEDGTYLFMDNDNWKGNLRITAMRLNSGNEEIKKEYLKNHLSEEFNENSGASRIRLGNMDAVEYTKDIEQDGDTLEMHYWSTGDKTTLLICTFTIDKNRVNEKEVKTELNYAIKTLSSIKILD
jgi:hypothetical protein